MAMAPPPPPKTIAPHINGDGDGATPPLEPHDLLERVPIGHPDAMMSAESVRRAVEEFATRPDDVIVATFPKTGTTLATWICHLLRTGARDGESLEGHDSLYDAIPWPMLSWDVGIDPNVSGSEYEPRVFKSHLRMASIYPGCKYVVTVRDPGRTALSFYNFFLAKRVPFLVKEGSGDDSSERPEPLMDASAFLVDTPFVRGSPGTRASVWEYYAEYHALMACPSVLMLVYEDFVADDAARREGIRRLGKFLGVSGEDDDGLVDRTAAMSTKAYMAKLMSKFDEPYERARALGRAADVSQLAPGAKVALKEHTQTFDERATAFLEDRWKSSMGRLGYSDYASFCTAVRARNRKLFD